MLKRWSIIFLSAWLINSVIWFQVPASFVDINSSCTDTSEECLLEMSSLLSTAVHFYEDLNEDDGNHSHKIKYRNHFLINRISSPAILAPALQLFSICNTIPTTIKLYVGKYRTVSHFLPSYYNFLFRLSPF
ncbi:hypothetical protein ACFQZS_02280 [Mucilaginibacter calamicampi]|uniref:Uncharacterized protein n=1 Tax=Mucilaginibacter calamicampi TaxID=1302352 RepID=A0ABW2YSM4_9SPHI